MRHWYFGTASSGAHPHLKMEMAEITIITVSPHGAAGGVRGGMTYGETDEFGFRSVQDRVHIHDLHATMLHLLGIDHEKLTYRYAGRDFRLTDVAGRVIDRIIS